MYVHNQNKPTLDMVTFTLWILTCSGIFNQIILSENSKM